MRFKSGSVFVVLATLALVVGLQPAHAAAPTVFATRAAFDAAAPGLPLEDFETGVVANGGVISCNDPLSDGNEQGCFPAGTLKPGVTYSGDGALQPGLAMAGQGFAGAPNRVLVANYFIEHFQMDFSPGVEFAGMDLVSYFGADTCDVEIYDASGLKATNSSACTPAGAFVGFQSDTPITKIIVNSPTSQAEGVNNLAFGNLSASEIVAHPAILDTSGPAVNLLLSATLTSLGTPVAGATIHFEIDGAEVCSGVTGASGLASCGGVPEVLGVALSSTMTYTAKFNGGLALLPSSGSAGLIA